MDTSLGELWKPPSGHHKWELFPDRAHHSLFPEQWSLRSVDGVWRLVGSSKTADRIDREVIAEIERRWPTAVAHTTNGDEPRAPKGTTVLLLEQYAHGVKAGRTGTYHLEHAYAETLEAKQAYWAGVSSALGVLDLNTLYCRSAAVQTAPTTEPSELQLVDPATVPATQADIDLVVALQSARREVVLWSRAALTTGVIGAINGLYILFHWLVGHQ